MEKNEFSKMIIDNWAQASVLITIITASAGYIIKIFLDRKTKQLEIKKSIFYQEQIKHINAFLKVHFEAQELISEIIFRIENEKKIDDEIKKLAFELTNLTSSIIEKSSFMLFFIEKKKTQSIRKLIDLYVKINSLNITSSDIQNIDVFTTYKKYNLEIVETTYYLKKDLFDF